MFNYRRFSEVLQSAEDFIVDIPKFWEYLAELVEPLFGEGGLGLASLGPFTSSLKPPMATKFIAAVFKELVKSKVNIWYCFYCCTLRFQLIPLLSDKMAE